MLVLRLGSGDRTSFPPRFSSGTSDNILAVVALSLCVTKLDCHGLPDMRERLPLYQKYYPRA